MLDIQTQEAVKDFVEAVQSSNESQRYIAAQTEYSANPQLIELRGRYTDLIQGFQRKQADGSYTQQDIDDVREVQMQVNGHPAAQEVLTTQAGLQEFLQACNQQLSTVLGMNFAQIARSTASCGCGGSCDC